MGGEGLIHFSHFALRFSLGQLEADLQNEGAGVTEGINFLTRARVQTKQK